MMTLFASPVHAINFWTCGFFCLAYLATNVVSGRFLFYDVWNRLEDDFYWAIFLTNLYGLLLSLPLMPFVYVQSGMMFSVTIISLFALSNFIWQILFVNVYYKIKWFEFFITLSISNVLAWIVMALFNYHFYVSTAQWLQDTMMM